MRRSHVSQRSLEQLTAVEDPVWPMIRAWIADARQVVEVLPADRAQAETTLLALQVTTRSPMGALALETGGILVDHGWLRLLGSGHARLPDTLLTWNGLGEPAMGALLEGGFVVAVDVLGGVFALNGGGLGPEPGIHYFAPDRLAWEALECSHLAWIGWALTGDLAQFYASLRWPGWEQEVAALAPAYGISIYPFVWTAGPPVATRSRRTVPLAELWPLERAMAQQLQDVSPGTAIRVRITDDPSGTSS
jgi:uncharacterized protein DUF2625